MQRSARSESSTLTLDAVARPLMRASGAVCRQEISICVYFRVSWYFDLLEIIGLHSELRLTFTLDISDLFSRFAYIDACSPFSKFCGNAKQCVCVFAVLELQVQANAARIA